MVENFRMTFRPESPTQSREWRSKDFDIGRGEVEIDGKSNDQLRLASARAVAVEENAAGDGIVDDTVIRTCRTATDDEAAGIELSNGKPGKNSSTEADDIFLGIEVHNLVGIRGGRRNAKQKAVGAVISGQRVIPGVTRNEVSARTADEGVVPFEAIEVVVASQPFENVRARVARKDIAKESAGDVFNIEQGLSSDGTGERLVAAEIDRDRLIAAGAAFGTNAIVNRIRAGSTVEGIALAFGEKSVVPSIPEVATLEGSDDEAVISTAATDDVEVVKRSEASADIRVIARAEFDEIFPFKQIDYLILTWTSIDRVIATEIIAAKEADGVISSATENITFADVTLVEFVVLGGPYNAVSCHNEAIQQNGRRVSR